MKQTNFLTTNIGVSFHQLVSTSTMTDKRFPNDELQQFAGRYLSFRLSNDGIPPDVITNAAMAMPKIEFSAGGAGTAITPLGNGLRRIITATANAYLHKQLREKPGPELVEDDVNKDVAMMYDVAIDVRAFSLDEWTALSGEDRGAFHAIIMRTDDYIAAKFYPIVILPNGFIDIWSGKVNMLHPGETQSSHPLSQLFGSSRSNDVEQEDPVSRLKNQYWFDADDEIRTPTPYLKPAENGSTAILGTTMLASFDMPIACCDEHAPLLKSGVRSAIASREGLNVDQFLELKIVEKDVAAKVDTTISHQAVSHKHTH